MDLIEVARNRAGIAIAVAALGAVFVLGWVLQTRRDEQPPDYDAMRRYIVGKMTDEDIRRAYRAAHEDRLREIARRDAEDARDSAAQARACALAADPVYRERYGASCGGGIQDPLPLGTEEEFIERRLLGLCALVATVRAAEKAGCLP